MWKDVINFEGLYKINEFGDIYSILTNRILKPYLSNKGYKIIQLSKNGKGEKFLIHRLVAIHFVPNPNNFPIVLHKDNNKLNTFYENLIWGTYEENNRQAIKDGLNKIPIPDNRKYYEIYNDNNSIVCCGVKEVIKRLGFGTNSNIRNFIFRNSEINQGPYIGYKIRRKNIIRPIRFDNFR